MSRRGESEGGLLLLQPAFLGDVVLSTAILEAWHAVRPEDSVSVVVRQEAAGLLKGHPWLDAVHPWKRNGWRKYPRLLGVSAACRVAAPRRVVNLHRFDSMAWLAARVGAVETTAFEGTPAEGRSGVSVFPHGIGDGRHETERNHAHIADVVGPFAASAMPRLHPTASDEAKAAEWPEGAILFAPGSVWPTKRWPSQQWSALADAVAERWPDRPVVLLGGPGETALFDEIIRGCRHVQPLPCAGALNLLASAALMARSTAVVSNDSAPLHMAGAMRCPVVGVFCSTTPTFGFGVLPGALEAGWGENVEVGPDALSCKPCGIHGLRQCPERHFRCGRDLEVSRVLAALSRVSSLP